MRTALLAVLAASVALLALLPSQVQANIPSRAAGQAATALPPALPIVYLPVTARVDGQLTADLSGLTVRVGGWTGAAQRLNDGSYLLTVGPPDITYVGKRVTFELGGRQATLAYDFPDLREPRFEVVELVFGQTQASATPTTTGPSATPGVGTPTPVGPPLATPAVTPEATPVPSDGDGGVDVPWARVGLIALAGVALFAALSWVAGKVGGR